MALRTTELTAVAVLKGEMIVQMDIAQQVAFATVKERVRSQLDNVVDDPDFVELFDLLCIGVGKNSYVDHLLAFASQFVDSTKRQLRLGSFVEVNKVNVNAPRTKVALIKRAYRKKPKNGFCPSPESVWGTFGCEELQYLEELLRYFHVTCKPKWEEKPKPQSRTMFLANVDVAATDAFYAVRPLADKKQFEKTRKGAYCCRDQVCRGNRTARGQSKIRGLVDRIRLGPMRHCHYRGHDVRHEAEACRAEGY